jgi:hypothetical protein
MGPTVTANEVTQRLQQLYNDTFTKNERRTWIYCWFISGMLTIIIPLIIFVTSRRVNTDDDDGEGDANNNNNNNNNNNQENNQSSSPWWYFGMNGGNDNRRDGERTPPILIATYLWSILVFHGILFYGYRALRYSSTNNSNPYDSIIVALVLFTNYNILSVLLLSNVEGAIETEGPGVDEHGFVGQFGVMVRSLTVAVFLNRILYCWSRCFIFTITATLKTHSSHSYYLNISPRLRLVIYTMIDLHHVIAMGHILDCIWYTPT